MPLKKALLSILAVFVFVTYSIYEHAHGDQADLVTLLMNDVASRSQNGATASAQQSTGSSDAQQTNPAQGTMTPAEYAQYIAQVNAQAAAYQQSHPSGQGVSRNQRQSEDEEQSAAEDEGGQFAAQPAAQTQAQTQAPAQQSYQTQGAAQQAAQADAQAQADVQAQALAAQQAAQAAQKAQQPAGQYRDGSYTGSSVYVFYGYVQVKAIIQNGQLADVRFLQYPNDRNTSIYINSQAMPLLTQEAIQAQSAQVDGVSGASATSQGFVQSLGSALSQAHT